MKQRISMGSPEDRRFDQKTLISFCEIFFSHIFRAFWNLWNVLRKCLDIELLYRHRSLTFSNGLLTKGRPLEARHETKDFNGKPGRPWIWAKNIQFHFARYFSPIFSSFLKPIKYFAKMLRYWFTIQISKSDGLPRSSNKRKTVRSPSWSKRFQWEARKTVDLSKKLLISLCEIFFTHIFRAFWKLLNIYSKMLRYWFTIQISKSDGLPLSPNKRKTVRSPSWNKRFQWEARKTVDLSKKHSNSLCEISFSHIFRAFWNLLNILRKCLDIELLYRYRSLTVFHGLLTKGRPLEARHETNDFNGKPGRP